MSFKDFRHGEVLHPRAGITLRTGALNHPNGATGYRIEYGGKVVAYITDTEHRPGERDPHVLTLINGAAPARTRDLPCIELTARDCD